MLTSFKRKLILLSFLIIVFAAFVAARFIVLNNQNVYGRLKILSSPNAGVFIDNVPAGKTPFENKYKEGEYTVKLIPEGNEKEIASWQGKVKIYKNALTFVNRELGASDNTSAGEILTITKMEKKPENPTFGEIFIETEPIGALIYLDNDGKSTAPFILDRVLKGDHELSAYMPGFLRRTQKINVSGGYRVNAVFKLALDPTQQKPIEDADPEATDSANISGSPTPTTKTPSPSPSAKAGDIDRAEVQVQVLNGSGIAGKATALRNILTDKGYTTISTGNAANFDYTTSEIQVKTSIKGLEALIKADLKDSISAPKITQLPDSSTSDIVVIFGTDFE